MIANGLLRVGLTVVFVWMGVDKLLRPDVWLSELPGFLAQYGSSAVYALAGVQLLIAALLLSRLYKVGAAIGGVLIIGVIAMSGFNAVAATHVGLMFMALALIFYKEHDQLARAELHKMLWAKEHPKPRTTRAKRR